MSRRVGLIEQRTAFVNQLRHALAEYYPTALEAFQRTVLSDKGVDLGRHLGRKGGGATGSQVRMNVHALEERGEHAPGLVYHEHHIMEKLQAPREDAGSDHHGVPDTHFGWIPEVMFEIEAARARRRETRDH